MGDFTGVLASLFDLSSKLGLSRSETIISCLGIFIAGLGVFVAVLLSLVYIVTMANSNKFSKRIDLVEKGMDALHGIVDKMKEILDGLQKNQNDLIPLIRKGFDEADRTRDKIKSRGVESWDRGYRAVKAWIEKNHEAYQKDIELYIKKIQEEGFSVLAAEEENTLREAGKSGQKMSDVVNEKVFPDFKKSMLEFVMYICEKDKLPRGWSIEMKQIFNTYMRSWLLHFDAQWEEGKI